MPDFGRHILELSVAQVAVQNVPVDAGDEEIHLAVVVEVRRGRAHGIPGARPRRLARVTSVNFIPPSLRKSRFQYLGESFSSDGIAAPLVKKMSVRPSPL